MRSHLVAFVLATVRHQDIPVVSLGSQPGSSGSGTSGRNDNVMQGLSSEYYQPFGRETLTHPSTSTVIVREIANSSYFRSHASRIRDPTGPVFVLEVQDDTKLDDGVWKLATEMQLWLQKSGCVASAGGLKTSGY